MKHLSLLCLIAGVLLFACDKEAPKEAAKAEAIPMEASAAKQDALVIYTEISGVSDGVYDKQNPYGFYGEIVIEIQKRIGDETEIKIVPWARSYADTLKNRNTMLFPMNRTAEREDLFFWVGPLMNVRYSLYARKGSGIKITSLEDAKKVKTIGTVQDDTREDFLTEQGFTNLEATYDNELNIKKLFADRVQLITGSSTGIGKQLARAGYSLDQVEEVYTLFTGALYIAFSKNTNKNILENWEKAFKEIVDDGTYKRLCMKWFPKEKL